VQTVLQEQDLTAVYNGYDWSLCGWPGLGNNERWKLRSALERHVLPLGSEEHPTHSCLSIVDTVVMYDFSFGMTSTVLADSAGTGKFLSNVQPLHFAGDGISELPITQPGHRSRKQWQAAIPIST
jgi:hypothetical protein